MPCRPLLICAALAAILLTGCSTTVELDTPASNASADAVCSGLLEDAPSTVDGLEAREVDPPDAGRAWGDPEIVLQCGVSKPAGLTRTSRCAQLDGVGWFSEKGEDAYTFTTIGREAYVQVTVPAEYDPPADALIDLAKTIKKHDEVEQECV